MAEIIPANRIESLDHVYTRSSTSPAKGVSADGRQWVVKLKGAGPGPLGLLTEFVALRAAAGMSLNVPYAEPVYLPPDFPWTIGTDEFDGIVQRSFGWNLGVAFIEGATLADAQDAGQWGEEFVGNLIQVDRALANTDRARRNPNILTTPCGPVAIDFDACLFLRRAARGMVPTDFPLWPDHLMIGRDGALPEGRLCPETVTRAVDEAPREWAEAVGIDRRTLRSGLVAYCAAWNAAVREEA